MSMMRELRKITDQVNDIHANTLVAQQIALELSDITGHSDLSDDARGLLKGLTDRLDRIRIDVAALSDALT